MKSRIGKIITVQLYIIVIAIACGLAFSILFYSRSQLPIEQDLTSTIPGLSISMEYPSTMTLKHSYLIKISLIPATESLISSIKLEKPTVIANSPTPESSPGSYSITLEDPYPTPIVTPGTSLLQARGLRQDLSAIASLNGVDPDLNTNTYLIQPSVSAEQPLNQSQVNWEWDVTPEESGNHYLILNIELQWKSTKDSGQEVSSQLYTYSLLSFAPVIFIFDVKNEFPEIDWSSVITSVVSGALLSFVIWFVGHLWEESTEESMQPRSRLKRKH